jgi:rhomboid protease GluP
MNPGRTALQLRATARPTAPARVRNFIPHPVVNATQTFSLCAHCKRPTPHREPACVNCGTRLLQKTARHALGVLERRFLHAFFTRHTPIAYAIFFFNLALYLWMVWQTPGSLVENLARGVDGTVLLAFGAKTNAALFSGEFFRIITPIFLHLSGVHLLANSFALALVGPQVERLYGSARFLAIYVLAGLGGMVSSTLAHALEGKRGVVAVGASGAIFGLFGVLAVFSFKYRKELPAQFINSFALAVLPAIGVNLLIGFAVPVIDNSTHVGGLLAGVLLAFMIPYLLPGRERLSLAQLAIVAVCVTVLAFCYTRAYQVSPNYLRASRQAGLETATLIP